MSVLSNHINELKATEAFDKQSQVFDQLYGNDKIIHYKRERVREHILKHAPAEASMLELNCGTGEDALFFAGKGFQVHATDISTGMLEQFERKLDHDLNSKNISIEQCSFTQLQFLQNKGPFDYVYSNFGGLNCTSQLDNVLHSLNAIVKPNGIVTLVIISKFCLWEFLLFFKGKLKMAFRRFFAAKGRSAHIEGTFFKCWYYSPSFVKKHMGNEFELLSLEGLCAIVPPSSFEHFAEKHPNLFATLRSKEDKLKNKWPWNMIGDYFIITFRKKN